MKKIKAKVDKNRCCIVNLFSFAEMEAMNKAEIALKLALKPFCGENENLKSGAEMQREACKGKTINEVTDVFK